jgi:tetratricopeptide (TPR) repeat protein
MDHQSVPGDVVMGPMHERDLDSAIIEIIQACPDSNGTTSPFFFIVGAGLSHPIIETASGLMDECKAKALKSGNSTDPPSQDRMATYSHWMAAAFPHAEQRRKYLQEKVQNKNISPATLRLAHLLHNGRIARTVVTPNFDDFLTRALTLFGVPHIMCDHPHTVRRLATASEIRQILHVHGTYWFYDCCNLKAEIEQRTQDSAASVFSFLANLLWQRSPIVIGYSGWEDDVIMTALKSRLAEQVLPFNMYWFCYDRDELQKLPGWLTGHQSIRFVVQKTSSNIAAIESPMSLGAPPGSYLDAVTVLSGFIQNLKLDVPPLFNDPLRFFANQIECNICVDEDHRSDIYNLKHLVAKINSVADQNERMWSQNNNVDINATLVEKVLNAVRRANFHEALNICAQIAPATLNAPQRDNLVNSLADALRGLRNRNADLALQACEWVLAFGGDIDDANISEARETGIVHSSFIKGELLMQMERNAEAISAFDFCIKSGRQFKHDMPKCSKVADAIFCNGLALDSLKRSSEAINVYNELWDTYIDYAGQDQHVRQLLARSRTNEGMAYQNLDRYDEALACFREVRAKFGNATDEPLHEPVA